MFFVRVFVILVISISIFSGHSYAQISSGGVPLKILENKSAKNNVVEMPALNHQLLKQSSAQEQLSDNKLKPLRFAHPFEVDLSPSNSGEWFNAENGYKIWKLSIRSKGAKSINLIFDQFKLPSNARLYIYNKYRTLGSFNEFNNKDGGKFAIAPIKGDEITVQLEVPSIVKAEEYFVITKVNHDYIGILDINERRPLGKVAGACNIDVNCEMGADWEEVKNSVCRIIVNGNEICSAFLINNTAEDEKPYVLSAAHCYDKWEYAETTVYVFNYESPFCAPLDGDPSNSVSGALMKALSDSVDFALAELSLVPPPEYRPFYAGWNRSSALPNNTVSIHHPQGDIKKIAFDYDSPVIASFNSNYVKNNFLRILNWDDGVTESGSSGGPLFDEDKRFIGTLTGGEATCSNTVNDYFQRFSNSWDYYSDSTKQLKYWLDPLNTNALTIDGKQFNTGENLCGAYTNLTDEDSYDLYSISISGEFSGYWGGTNSIGMTEFVERFSILGNEQLSGISFGVGKVHDANGGGDSEITIKVYNGNGLPETLIYSQNIKIKYLVEDAMNFIGFNEIVEPADSFFIGFELSNIQVQDSFVVLQSLRKSYEENSFYLKQDNSWYRFNDANPSGKSMANVFELVACNIDDFSSDTPKVNNPLEILLYPNPTQSSFVLEAGKDISENNIGVYNLIGQKMDVKIANIHSRKAEIDLSGNAPGVYFVRIKTDRGYTSRKISFVPW